MDAVAAVDMVVEMAITTVMEVTVNTVFKHSGISLQP